MIQRIDVHSSLPLITKGIRLPTWGMRLALSFKHKHTFSFSRKYLSTTTCSISNPSKNKHKVIVISGPTGAGKSKLAIELAKKLNGEIISADSVQVYRGLDIGSAKPSVSDRKEIPHHLIDILHPSEEYSAGQFFEDARKSTKEVLERGKVPIIAGGTGLYLRWFVYGKPDVPKVTMEVASEVCSELEEFMKRGNWDEAVEYVVKAGNEKAYSIPYNNWYRLRRSLEVIRSSGSPPSAFEVPYDSFRDQVESNVGIEENLAKELEYDFICLFLSSPRINLYRAIDLRCEEMLMDTEGLLSEASWLLDIGLQSNMNSATRAIGYRQAMEYLLGCRQEGGKSCPVSFRGFLFEFQKASRNFAKRQLTWFRNENIYHWLDASQPLETILDFIYNAYHEESVVVPESIQMEKNVSGRQETYEIKSYRTKNRIFRQDEDCYHILDWVRRTQRR
ncbi:tRNA dimethylallyltransferase 9 [Asparagus officinalis]|uniref:tRNA dimethylallyltransferase 9 n=1 Tax=Asparagus officinalis TaxID=4686 RepID=UPI00098E1311|nr:tRNA dimethylallyltransferase 9 [Asparagus officinalis]XP_020242208.1 tRNA dimethylallyltransferase 9 [Asparagus officinalis]